MATKAQNKTEDSVSKEPKGESFTDKSRQAIKNALKLKAASQFTPLDLAYGIYKKATGKFPLENAVSDLEFYTKPRPMDTGSVPVGTQFNSSDFDSNELDKGGAAKKYAKGGSVSSRADGIAQRGKTKGRIC